MKIKIILFVVFLGLCFSCSHEKPLVFTPKNIAEADLSICKESPCPEVTVTYIEVSGDTAIAEKVNLQIHNFICQALFIGPENTAPISTSIVAAMESFIEIWRRDSQEFPDMSADYVAEVTVTESHTGISLLSFEQRSYLFTGGAHGYGHTSFLNIDPRNGERISREALFTNIETFTSFAEGKFREAQGILEGDSINSTGFWFENDRFALPEAIGFSDENLILHYNQYEIASYADGPIEIEIPLSEIEAYLKFE